MAKGKNFNVHFRPRGPLIDEVIRKASRKTGQQIILENPEDVKKNPMPKADESDKG